MNELNTARIDAELCAELCLSTGLDLPEDKFFRLPGAALPIAVNIRGDICSYLNFRDIGAEALADTIQQLEEAFRGMGYLLRDAEKPSSEYEPPVKTFLRLFDKDDTETKRNACTALLLIALRHLSLFFRSLRHSMLTAHELEDIEKANISHVAIIDALGHLLCAQEAFMFGVHCHARFEGKEFAEMAGAWFSEAVPKLMQHNRDQRFQAFHRWKPLVEEVKELMAKSKRLTKNGAATKIAKKHQVSHRALYNAIDKYWSADSPSDVT